MLLRLNEVSEVFADACLRDPAGNLQFLSVYGRDTAIQQMIASFSLPANQGGCDTLHLADGQHLHLVLISDPDRLTKLTGRLPRDNLFGQVAQAWIFDPALRKADRVKRRAWVFTPDLPADPLASGDRLWDTYRQLSPIPLLDHWRQPLLEATAGCVTRLGDTSFPPLGRIAEAYLVQLGNDFVDTVSQLVKCGVLTLDPAAGAATPS